MLFHMVTMESKLSCRFLLASFGVQMLNSKVGILSLVQVFSLCIGYRVQSYKFLLAFSIFT